jgi:SRSO17 transposase
MGVYAMTSATAISTREASPAHIVELASLCRDLFASFTRSDQRRWGEVYVRGLLSVSGRKSIRRMAEQVVGWEAEQCLQQFVNQSPWDWVPVRRRLMEHAMPSEWTSSTRIPSDG